MAGHLLVLEDAARILAVTGRTMRTVADRNTVGRAHTAETPALHHTGKALTLGHALDVDDLAGDEMVSRQFGADVERRVVGRSEEHTSELQSLKRYSYAVFCLKKHNTR